MKTRKRHSAIAHALKNRQQYIDNGEMRQLIADQLEMEATHRRRVSFEKRHEKNSFELEGTDSCGALKK